MSAAALNKLALREHAAHRAALVTREHAVHGAPLVRRELAAQRREVVARSAATIREAHLSRPSARMRRVACAASVDISTRTAYAVFPEISTAMGSVVKVLVRVVYAYRRWRRARPKDFLATARPNRLVLILHALGGVAQNRPDRACYPRVFILKIHQTCTLLGHTCTTYTDSAHYYLRPPISAYLSMLSFSHAQCTYPDCTSFI